MTLSEPITSQDKGHIKHNADFWSAMFVMLGFVQFTAFVIQGIAFAKCSESLIRRVRDTAFRTMLRQDVAFFDQEANTSGALTSFLSTETTHMAGLSGVTLGTIVLVLTTLIAAEVVAISIGWKLALVCTACMPILLGCGFFRFRLLAHFQRRSRVAYASSASFASEAISAIRTVAALTREDDVLAMYHESLAVQQRKSLISVAKSSALYAASQSLLFLCLGLGFWYGSTLIAKGEYNLFQFFLAIQSVIFGAQVSSRFLHDQNFANVLRSRREAFSRLRRIWARRTRQRTN